MPKKEKTFIGKAKSWALKESLEGQSAFLRYVMFLYTQNINKVSNEFVFKGGNLLWLYIKTPRSTVDLDFATKKLSVHGTVKAILEEAGKLGEPDISYRIIQFKEITQQGMAGASVQVEFKTHDGARNIFNLDIVYAIGSEETELESPIEKQSKILSSKIERIIADKIISCHRFKGGNTRMKDFDDLWRISRSGQKIERRVVRKLTNHVLDLLLKSSWIDESMRIAWRNHRVKYKDLPETLDEVFSEVNSWLVIIAK